MYFAFVSFYAKSLIVPSLTGAVFRFINIPYNPGYSVLLCLWSIIFVEWWRIRERAIAVRWGSYGSTRVELRRSQFRGANDANDEHDDTSFPWWKREARIAASLPVIGFFAAALVALLTTIFVVEAFVTQLYTGPGVKYVSLTPTALFLLLVPRLVGFYQKYAVKLTGWENQVHESSHEKSQAFKTFALSQIVAYGGLYLSAFVYIPFGEQIMQLVQQTFFTSPQAPIDTTTGQKVAAVKDARKILNPDRLTNQMYAYLVTNQVIGTMLEVGIPSIQRLAGKAMGKAEHTDVGQKALKKVGWEDEKNVDGPGVSAEEAAFLKHARSQVTKPAYDVFGEDNSVVRFKKSY